MAHIIFTVSQRKALHVWGQPENLFVISTDTQDNIIILAWVEDHPGVLSDCLFVKNEENSLDSEDLKIGSRPKCTLPVPGFAIAQATKRCYP